MPFEIQVQAGGLSYTVRAPSADSAISLVQQLQMLLAQIDSIDVRDEPIFPDITKADRAFGAVKIGELHPPAPDDTWRDLHDRLMNDIAPAVAVVQANQDFFNVGPGDDAIPAIARYFCERAVEHGKLRVSDRPGDGWTTRVGATIAPLPADTPIVVQHRDGTTWRTHVGGANARRWSYDGGAADIVAYKVVKP